MQLNTHTLLAGFWKKICKTGANCMLILKLHIYYEYKWNMWSDAICYEVSGGFCSAMINIVY